VVRQRGPLVQIDAPVPAPSDAAEPRVRLRNRRSLRHEGGVGGREGVERALEALGPSRHVRPENQRIEEKGSSPS
jgi:hypothetical protein